MPCAGFLSEALRPVRQLVSMPWSTVYEIRQCAVDELVTLSLGVAGTKRTERHPTQSLWQRVVSRGWVSFTRYGQISMMCQAKRGTQCCVPGPRSSLVIYAYHVNNINNTIVSTGRMPMKMICTLVFVKLFPQPIRRDFGELVEYSSHSSGAPCFLRIFSISARIFRYSDIQ